MKQALFCGVAAVAASILIIAAYLWRNEEGLAFLGSVASVIGLVVTVHIAIAVHNLRERYASRAMLASSVTKMRSVPATLSEAIQSRDIDTVLQTLGETRALLSEINLHLPGNERIEWSMDEFDRIIHGDRRKIFSRARALSASIQAWITAVDLHIEKSGWRRDDG